MLQDGDKSPDFELPTDGGDKLRLSRLEGKPVVLYFYPKDDTSGCTVEAKDFTQLAPDFRKAGVEVIGVSPDSAESHARFRKRREILPLAEVFQAAGSRLEAVINRSRLV